MSVDLAHDVRASTSPTLVILPNEDEYLPDAEATELRVAIQRDELEIAYHPSDDGCSLSRSTHESLMREATHLLDIEQRFLAARGFLSGSPPKSESRSSRSN
jgi:hypothetical protein